MPSPTWITHPSGPRQGSPVEPRTIATWMIASDRAPSFEGGGYRFLRIRGPIVPMPSHLTLNCARRCRALGELKGALSSCFDAAALGADRAGLPRARRGFPGRRLLGVAAARRLWSTSGPKGPRRRLRRRVPVNPGRRAGDAAREAAARRAVGRVAADLPPRVPPEAACRAPAAATRRCRRARAPSPCRRHERRRAASVRRGRGRGELRQQRERQRGAADRRGEVRL